MWNPWYQVLAMWKLCWDTHTSGTTSGNPSEGIPNRKRPIEADDDLDDISQFTHSTSIYSFLIAPVDFWLLITTVAGKETCPASVRSRVELEVTIYVTSFTGEHQQKLARLSARTPWSRYRLDTNYRELQHISLAMERVQWWMFKVCVRTSGAFAPVRVV